MKHSQREEGGRDNLQHEAPEEQENRLQTRGARVMTYNKKALNSKYNCGPVNRETNA